MMNNLNRLAVCLGIAALSVICVACSIKAGDTDPDRTSVTETSVVETEMTTVSTTKESTSETDTTAPGVYTGPEITPPAERVYPITAEAAIATFELLGLSHENMTPEYDYIEEEVAAYDPAFTYIFFYCAFTEDSLADSYLETLQKSLAEDENAKPLEGTSEITEEDGYSMLIVSGRYKDGKQMYAVAISVGNTIVTGYVESTDEWDTKVIDYCFIGLGYM
jgi:hypothetical protein